MPALVHVSISWAYTVSKTFIPDVVRLLIYRHQIYCRTYSYL